MHIGKTQIGEGHPTFIIAEMSANHQQDIELAKGIIEAAKEAGADAIKLQTYTADTMTIDCDNDFFKIKQGTLWDGRTLYDLYKEAYTPWEWQPQLKDYAEKLGLICFSTPFDPSAADFLEKMDVPLYKIASFEIHDLPLIAHVAAKGKPILISTGVATLADIEAAVDTCKSAGNDQIILLKCTSAYPAPIEEVNLRTIPHMAQAFGVITGLSDHTLGISAPIAAVALGAKVIEKHFTIDRNAGGADSAFSLEPHEFAQMVQAVRQVEKALGTVTYQLTEKARTQGKVFARSLFVVKDMKAGEPFTPENLRSIRPGDGLPPKYLKEILGKKAKADIPRGTPMRWELVG